MEESDCFPMSSSSLSASVSECSRNFWDFEGEGATNLVVKRGDGEKALAADGKGGGVEASLLPAAARRERFEVTPTSSNDASLEACFVLGIGGSSNGLEETDSIEFNLTSMTL